MGVQRRNTRSVVLGIVALGVLAAPAAARADGLPQAPAGAVAQLGGGAAAPLATSVPASASPAPAATTSVPAPASPAPTATTSAPASVAGVATGPVAGPPPGPPVGQPVGGAPGAAAGQLVAIGNAATRQAGAIAAASGSATSAGGGVVAGTAGSAVQATAGAAGDVLAGVVAAPAAAGDKLLGTARATLDTVAAVVPSAAGATAGLKRVAGAAVGAALGPAAAPGARLATKLLRPAGPARPLGVTGAPRPRDLPAGSESSVSSTLTSRTVAAPPVPAAAGRTGRSVPAASGRSHERRSHEPPAWRTTRQAAVVGTGTMLGPGGAARWTGSGAGSPRGARSAGRVALPTVPALPLGPTSGPGTATPAPPPAGLVTALLVLSFFLAQLLGRRIRLDPAFAAAPLLARLLERPG